VAKITSSYLVGNKVDEMVVAKDTVVGVSCDPRHRKFAFSCYAPQHAMKIELPADEATSMVKSLLQYAVEHANPQFEALAEIAHAAGFRKECAQ
jgi:hypothetical protein